MTKNNFSYNIVESLTARKNNIGSIGSIQFLIDYHKRKSGQLNETPSTTYKEFHCKEANFDLALEAYKRRPPILPDELQIPEKKGLGNNYSFILEELSKSKQDAHVPVSIVILTYNRKIPLAKTLAGIVLQDYPTDLIEVIVTDDGSDEDTLSIVKMFSDKLTIKYSWHPDDGFNAAKARNNGVKLASNDFVILLDVDMYPSKGLVAGYVKWSSSIDKVVLIGPREYINLDDTDTEDLLSRKVSEDLFERIITNNDVAGKVKGSLSVDWRLEIFEKTDNLITEKRPYRVFASGNVAFSKKAFLGIGGFDERFNSWGYEDTELAYRFYNHGLYMVPELDALAFHQEPKGGTNEVDRSAGKEKSGKLFAQLCPDYRSLDIKHSVYQVPTVSIYIPAYNAENTICDAVESALNQTFKDLEVCVCDDGSTDTTRELLDRYYSNNPRVKYVTQKNGGIGAASNQALNLCKGHFVGQLDSDDYLATDVVEKCVKEFLKSPDIGLVYTTYENEYADGRIEPGYNYPVFNHEKLLTAMIVHHFRMFRKLYWHRAGGFNEKVKNAVDYDMYLKLAEVCEANHLNIVGYRRRLHGENTSIKSFKAQNENARIVVQQSLNRLKLGYDVELEDENKPKLIFNKD